MIKRVQDESKYKTLNDIILSLETDGVCKNIKINIQKAMEENNR